VGGLIKQEHEHGDAMRGEHDDFFVRFKRFDQHGKTEARSDLTNLLGARCRPAPAWPGQQAEAARLQPGILQIQGEGLQRGWGLSAGRADRNTVRSETTPSGWKSGLNHTPSNRGKNEMKI